MFVLIIEDHDDIREGLRLILEMRGHNVIEAIDGGEGVKKALEHRPDLILMDLSMPSLDGYGATRKLRTFPDFANTPVIAVTAHGNVVRDRALAAGCTEVIDKFELVKQIDLLLERFSD
jgi:two-component system, cell cycle response regulator DivK